MLLIIYEPKFAAAAIKPRELTFCCANFFKDVTGINRQGDDGAVR